MNIKRLKLNPKQERLFSVIFSFSVLTVGVYGYLLDSYTDRENPLVPNVLNLIFGKEIIPAENAMFIGNYYIDDSITYITADGRVICVLNPSYERDNMISGVWLYMIMLFSPFFIISMLDLKVEKITKERIKKMYASFLRYRNE